MDVVVTNINRNGDVFDPSAVTIHAGDIAGLDAAIRDCINNIASKSSGR